MKVMAVDYGQKRMGVAISDTGGKLARPLAVLVKTGNRSWAAVLEPLLREHKPTEIVIGYPRRLDGQPGTHAAAVEELAGDLKMISGVRIVLRDESLTTVEAAEKLLQAGLNRNARRRRIDAAAAAIILQEYLDVRGCPGN